MQSCLHFVQKIKKKSCIILRVSSFRPPPPILCTRTSRRARRACASCPELQRWSSCTEPHSSSAQSTVEPLFPCGTACPHCTLPPVFGRELKKSLYLKDKEKYSKKKKIHALLLKAVQEGSKRAKMKTILARILRIRCGFRRREKKGIRLGVCALRVCGSPKFGAAELNM